MTPQSALDWYDDTLGVPTLAQQLAWHDANPPPPAPPPPPRYFPPMAAEDLVRWYPYMTLDERDIERSRINTAARYVTDNLGHFTV